MNNNQELIKRCRVALQGEDEPHVSDWFDMVESLCNALEKADTELINLKREPRFLENWSGR